MAVVDAVADFLELLDARNERWHQRKDLVELDDRLLDDVGVSREEARRVAARPFWKP